MDDEPGRGDALRMIVLCGVDEFPAGPWTKDLASDFAGRIGAELVVVDGGAVRDHAPAIGDADDGVLLFGHAPPNRVAATLRASPCPVVVAPGGVSARDWRDVVLASHGDAASEDAAATAGALAARLGAPLRRVVAPPPGRSTVSLPRPSSTIMGAWPGRMPR